MSSVIASRYAKLIEQLCDLDDGRLAASGPGVLQFRSDKLPKEITEDGESVQLALQALADGVIAVYAPDVRAQAIRAGLLLKHKPTDGTTYHVANCGDVLAIVE